MPSFPDAPMPTESAGAGEPRFRRARGFRLYDMRGRRWLDLSRRGALLGHRPVGVLSAMKAVLSQGLAGDVPSVWEARLAAHVAGLFPSFPVVRLYLSPEGALEAASDRADAPLNRDDVMDPALCPAGAGGAKRAAFWRPFLPTPAGAPVLLPILPFTVGGAPAPVCFASAPSAACAPADTIPGFLCAGALRALAAAADPGLPEVYAPASPRLAAALDGSRGWARTGPYVRAVFPRADYAWVHAEFLRAGVLLCPVYPGPSVLPGECSPGETSLLAGLFARIPGG
jgi:hypothetical protein